MIAPGATDAFTSTLFLLSSVRLHSDVVSGTPFLLANSSELIVTKFVSYSPTERNSPISDCS
jgi:hypothetical protein